MFLLKYSKLKKSPHIIWLIIFKLIIYNKYPNLRTINFQNSKCTYDTNKNLYVNKKKSRGKVDMVVSLINAMYLLEQDYFLNQGDFVIQVL